MMARLRDNRTNNLRLPDPGGKTVVGMLLFLLFSVCWSCSKESSPTIDCERLASGLIQKDLMSLTAIINKIADNLLPVLELDDPTGQHKNLRLLVERLNSPCQSITAEIRCYGCIYTLPARSEILIKV